MIEKWAWLFAYLVAVVTIITIVKVADDEFLWPLLIPFFIGAAVLLVGVSSPVAGVAVVISFVLATFFQSHAERSRRRTFRLNHLRNTGSMP